MIPFGMGQKVEFQKNFGPKLGEINKEEMFNLKETYFSDKLQPIYKLINNLKRNEKLKIYLSFKYNSYLIKSLYTIYT